MKSRDWRSHQHCRGSPGCYETAPLERKFSQLLSVSHQLCPHDQLQPRIALSPALRRRALSQLCGVFAAALTAGTSTATRT